MNTQLDPIVSEFETQEQADSYDRWLKAKVQRSIDNPGQGMPHDQVMTKVDAIIADGNADFVALGHFQKAAVYLRADATPSAISELEAIAQQLTAVQEQLSKLLQGIPNIPHESVPEGQTEADNLEMRRWGEPREFEFEPQDHVALGVELGMMDFDGAAKISGSRFVVLSGPLSRLQRALTQFMLDLHTEEHGYVETYVPFLVNSDSLFGTGQLPKFEEDQFSTDTNPKYFLIPTAEVSLTNLVRETILDESALPVRMTGRKTAGRGAPVADHGGTVRRKDRRAYGLPARVLPQRDRHPIGTDGA
mgnify:CR=1 FL=1